MPSTRAPSPRPERPLDDARWSSVLKRDPNADGQFWYAVRTTGVYCRPSCGARTPRRENVEFHDTRLSAEQAGFRPCKRCRPDEPLADLAVVRRVADICRIINANAEPPGTAALADQVGLGVKQLQREFKAVTGLTPRAYALASRAARLREGLVAGSTVTQAYYSAGFNSSGRFYESAEQVLGMKPRQFRAGGAEAAIRYAVRQTSLGRVLVGMTDKGVCAILLGDNPDHLVHDLRRRFPRAELIRDEAEFGRTIARVVALVEAPRQGLDLPLDVCGTAFQHRVWQSLRTIPAGQTLSYRELAARIGQPKAARAVASACAANALAVAIPCHRAVAADGSLSGYRWGLARKRELLSREADERAASDT